MLKKTYLHNGINFYLKILKVQNDRIGTCRSCADIGGGGVRTPLEFAKLNIADITGNEKNSYLSYLCTSAVIRQTAVSYTHLTLPTICSV